MKYSNNYLFNISLIIISIILIFYLLYLNDRRITKVEHFFDGYDVLAESQNEKLFKLGAGDLYYIECKIYNKDKTDKTDEPEHRYRLYCDLDDENKLKFGKIIPRPTDRTQIYLHNGKYYLLNDPVIMKEKNFIFNLKSNGNTNFKIKNSNSDTIIIGENPVSNVKLIKQQKAGTDNYKIYVNENKAFIMDIIKDNIPVYNNYENDIDCALYNLEYKKELTNKIKNGYKSFEELPKQNLSPSYTEKNIEKYLEKKKNIEISNKSNYCPIDKPFPYDTINTEVTINDEDNIDFEINYNNKCCSVMPEFFPSFTDLIDETTQEKLQPSELPKLKKYIDNKNIKLLNKCSDIPVDGDRNKRNSFLNLKNNEKVLLYTNSNQAGKDKKDIKQIKDLDTIITDYDNNLSHYINQRTLFEIIPVYDSSGVEIEGMTEFTYSTLVSKIGKGTE